MYFTVRVCVCLCVVVFLVKFSPFSWGQNILSGCILQSVYVCNIRWSTHTPPHTPMRVPMPFDNAIAWLLAFLQAPLFPLPFLFFLSIYACTYFVSVYKRWFDTYKSGVFVCCRSPFVLVYLDFYDDAPLVSALVYLPLSLSLPLWLTHTRSLHIVQYHRANMHNSHAHAHAQQVRA